MTILIPKSEKALSVTSMRRVHGVGPVLDTSVPASWPTVAAGAVVGTGGGNAIRKGWMNEDETR